MDTLLARIHVPTSRYQGQSSYSDPTGMQRRNPRPRLYDRASGYCEGGNCKVERGRKLRPESIRYTAVDRNSRREGSPGYYGWNSVWGACGKGLREVQRDASLSSLDTTTRPNNRPEAAAYSYWHLEAKILGR